MLNLTFAPTDGGEAIEIIDIPNMSHTVVRHLHAHALILINTGVTIVVATKVTIPRGEYVVTLTLFEEIIEQWTGEVTLCTHILERTLINLDEVKFDY